MKKGDKDMKIFSSLMLIVCLVCAHALLVSCGESDSKDTGASPAAQSAHPQGDAIAESASSDDLNWDDIPIYPGAHMLERDSAMFKQMAAKSRTGKGGMRSFETDASAEEVLAYYEKTLPERGWEKIMGMPMGERSMLTTWSKTGEDRGISVTVSKSSPDNKVYFTIIQGQD
jgi:major membrane immunogen (membrane-anchored lipoprotein)